MSDLLLRCFWDLWKNEKSRDSILRRLPIIAAEENWRTTADVMYTVQVAGRLLKRGCDEEIVGWMVAKEVLTLSREPKSKEADGLQNRANAWLNANPVVELNLQDQLDNGDELLATAAALQMIQIGEKKPLWTTLLSTAATRSALSVRLVEAFMTRFGQGALPGDLDLLVAGAVLAVTRVSEEIEIPTDWQNAPMIWQAADAHTGPGKVAKAVAVRKLGIDHDRLWTLWFLLESAEVDQKSNENYWWDKTLAEESQRLGFATVDDAREEWGRYRATVKEVVLWAVNK